MDGYALRAVVNGAVRGDSALVSADQLMAATRRDHPLFSSGIPGVTRVLGGKSGVATAADAGYSMIFGVDFQPGAGS
jgi:hypothetical protein